MAIIHYGNRYSLSSIATASISHADIGFIYFNERVWAMVFDLTGDHKNEATDMTNHPYYLRPDDYAANGVWVEDPGYGSPDVWSGDQIVTGAILSTNWVDGTSGMKIDLDNGLLSIKDDTFGNAGVQLGWDSSAYKFNIKNGNVYFQFDGSHLTISVDANVGTGVGVIYKDAKRWLYDFNPAHNGTVQPDGYNLFLGVEAGNVTGTPATSMGASATAEDESSYNIGIGYRSAYSITKASYSIGIGYKALYSLSEGNSCVGIGTEACKNITTGDACIGIGHHALFTNSTADSSVAVGHGALYYSNGEANTAIGLYALYNITSGTYNVAIGNFAGVYITGGSDPNQTSYTSVYLGGVTEAEADGDDNEIVIGYSATGNGSDTVTLGNTSISEFHCQVALTVDSDLRIKRNINPTTIGLDFIKSLNPVTFQRVNPADYPEAIRPSNFEDRVLKVKEKDKEVEKIIKADPRPKNNDKKYIGLIAQDVEQVMKQQHIDIDSLVITSNRGKKSISYDNLIMPMITAIKELTARLETVEASLN